MNIKRTYYLLKCRTYILFRNLIERVLKTLSKLGFIVEHKEDYSRVRDQGGIQKAPDIKSDRFVFSTSYILSEVEFISNYWFETKLGKRILTMYENSHKELRVSYRAELESFFCHFSHKIRTWVHRHSPRVVMSVNQSFGFDSNGRAKFRYHDCDFSQCRYAFEMTLAKDSLNNSLEEVLNESHRVFGNSLTSKIPEINKTLTGVENDGNLTSPSNCPLCDNLVCRKCGYPVFATPEGRHTYECIHHGKLEYFDVDRVDPVRYDSIYNNCLTELEYFCECPQD